MQSRTGRCFLAEQIVGVDGMSCDHCRMRVEKAVKALQGVSSAEVNLEKKTVTVQYNDSETGLSQINAAIKAEGYSVVS